MTPNRLQYDDPVVGAVSYFIQITPVNANIAMLQFYFDITFAALIAPPLGFGVTEVAVGPIAPIFNSFFITWISDYRLTHNGVEILQITNQKQHALGKLNNATITHL
jgi:hypothetical protein